jgi:tRNA threonylcarbamoyladenosine biosynthesis protein TsaB
MRVLALDTTTPAGSVALVEFGVEFGKFGDVARVIAERRGDPERTHAERLPGAIVALVDGCGVAMRDVDLFAVASGPGSFTGLRIGIATIQGLAFVTGRRIVGVSALEALAQQASAGAAPGTIIGAWVNAHRGEVFSGLYRVRSAPAFDPDRLAEIESAAVGDPLATLTRWQGIAEAGVGLLVGDGAILYRDVVRRAAPATVVVEPKLLAGPIGLIAAARARRGETVTPVGIRPLYVRRPDAEIARTNR